MDVCLLTEVEVYRLQEYQIHPCHWDHKHISVSEALDGLKSDLLRIVGDGKGGEIQLPHFSVTEQSSNGRTWKNRMSDGVKTRQLVRIVQG